MKLQTNFFRAWNVKRNEWFDKGNIRIDANGLVFYHFGYQEGRILDKDEVKIMFSIGIKEFNNILIFDRDIIKWNNNLSIVKYEGCAFGFHGLEPYSNGLVEYSYDTITSPNFKQIFNADLVGNEYENPDLLEGNPIDWDRIDEMINKNVEKNSNKPARHSNN